MGNTKKNYNRIIIALSIIIPVLIAILFGVKLDIKLPVFLPPIYATINAITVVILCWAFIAIRRGQQKLHQLLMKTALFLSALFLLLYVLYHMTSDATSFGGEGTLKIAYFTLLISHIVLSVGVIPLVLITFVRGLTERFDSHKKLARIALPLWLYVALSGVLVYLLIAPYY
jgi:putative membrane protein